MKHGPLIFLASFFALAASWAGLVLVPQLQIGRLQQETNTVNTAELYPQARPGLARQGLDVYRAEGCAACHTQQVLQKGTECDLVLTDIGTNPPAVAEAFLKANAGVAKASGPGLAAGLPKPILRGTTPDLAKAALSAIQSAGAKAKISIIPTGPDIDRGWGPRRTVAADYLFDNPVMLGSQRVGPDLANVGLRHPEVDWQLRHLYAPRLEAYGSIMPPYRFLFERKRIGRQSSPDALQLPREFAPPPGYEIIPTARAEALATYLVSLHSDAPLFEAPMTQPPPPAAGPPPTAPAP